MQWSVSVRADGDREMTLAQITELADAVAEHSGIASGIGAHAFGAQLIVEADGPRAAAERGSAVFLAAAARAGLPPWPVSDVHVVSEEMDAADDPDEAGTAGAA
jgi:hypothetical protein